MVPKISRTSLYSPLLQVIPAAGCFLNLRATDTDKEYSDHTSTIKIIQLVILFLISNMYMRSYVAHDLPQKHLESLSAAEFPSQKHNYSNIDVYVETAVVVVVSYLSLVVIDVGFIVLVFFPLVALGFIVALCSALISRGNGGDADSGSTGAVTDKGNMTRQEAEQLKAMSVGPYLLLAVMGRLTPENIAVSRFLLFLSSTLGTLMLMMIRLPAGVAPGIAQASELLRKTSLVVLLVTVHTMAAELLGENVVLFIMPELVPALLWFSLNIDRGSPVITVDSIKSNRNSLIFLAAVVAVGSAYLTISMDESGVSRCTMISVSCGVSGLLVYYVVFMLRQWPEQSTATATSGVSSLEEAVKLLKFWAIFLLVAAAGLLLTASVSAVRLGLHEQAVPALRKFLNEYYV